MSTFHSFPPPPWSLLFCHPGNEEYSESRFLSFSPLLLFLPFPTPSLPPSSLSGLSQRPSFSLHPISFSVSLPPFLFPLPPKQTKDSTNNVPCTSCDSRKIRLAIFLSIVLFGFDFSVTIKEFRGDVDTQGRDALKILFYFLLAAQ